MSTFFMGISNIREIPCAASSRRSAGGGGGKTGPLEVMRFLVPTVTRTSRSEVISRSDCDPHPSERRVSSVRVSITSRNPLLQLLFVWKKHSARVGMLHEVQGRWRPAPASWHGSLVATVAMHAYDGNAVRRSDEEANPNPIGA